MRDLNLLELEYSLYSHTGMHLYPRLFLNNVEKYANIEYKLLL